MPDPGEHLYGGYGNASALSTRAAYETAQAAAGAAVPAAVEHRLDLLALSIEKMNAEIVALKSRLDPIARARGTEGVKIDWPVVAFTGQQQGGLAGAVLVTISGSLNGVTSYVQAYCAGPPVEIPLPP